MQESFFSGSEGMRVCYNSSIPYILLGVGILLITFLKKIDKSG